jgi:hypothetical protein
MSSFPIKFDLLLSERWFWIGFILWAHVFGTFLTLSIQGLVNPLNLLWSVAGLLPLLFLKKSLLWRLRLTAFFLVISLGVGFYVTATPDIRDLPVYIIMSFGLAAASLLFFDSEFLTIQANSISLIKMGLLAIVLVGTSRFPHQVLRGMFLFLLAIIVLTMAGCARMSPPSW